MFQTSFYFIVNMSISSSIVIIFLLLLRQIRIIPKRFIYPLWWLVLLRMSLPFAISSSISVFNSFSNLIKKMIPVGKIANGDFTVSNYLNATSRYTPMEYKTQRLSEIFNAGSIIWGVGVCTALLIIIVLYFLTAQQFKNSICKKDNIYINDRATSPFLLGILKSKIILPIDTDTGSSQCEHIIAHEIVHIKRADNLWRLVALVVVCLHWFNPFVWIGFSCFLKDMELSCDESAIRDYTTDKRKEYANALLTTAHKIQNPIHVSFGKSNTKTRILNVLTYQRLPLIGTIISIGFLLVIAIMLITNPKI